MGEQRQDDGTTEVASRAEEDPPGTADATSVVPTEARGVPAPREAPDDATTTVATAGAGAPATDRPEPQGHGHGAWGQAPPGYSPSGYAPQGHPPQQYAPQQYPPQQYPPQQYPPQQHAPQGHGGPRTGPQQAPPWGPPPGSQAPQGPPPWGPPPTGETGGARRRPRRAIVIGAVALVLVVVLVVVAVVLVDGALTRRSATRAAADVAGWSGVTYRGDVTDGLGGPAAVEMTVDGQGTAAGTITRAAGGRAEFVITRTNQAIRADEAWWATSAPRPRLAMKLGGVWVSGASDQLAAVSPWALSPGGLSRAVADRPWSDEETRSVGGVETDVLADGPDRIALDDTGDVPRLAQVELASFGRQRTSPVAAERANPQALQDVATTSGQLPSMPAFRAAVSSPPLAFARIDPIPDCFTPTCPVTVRVSNIGRYRTTGTLNVLVNDAPAASFPLDVAPGGTPVFTATVQNQAFSGNTAQVTVRVVARLTDLE